MRLEGFQFGEAPPDESDLVLGRQRLEKAREKLLVSPARFSASST
jgi:hypothetical protein